MTTKIKPAQAAIALSIILCLPLVLSRTYTDLLVFTGFMSIGGLGVAFLLGHCGIVNLAQALFFAIGAYASAIATTKLGWPPIAGVLTGVVMSAVISLLVGWPILRLRGFFLALATLCVLSIGNVLFFELDWLTGGSMGIGNIPRVRLLGLELDTPARYYYFVWTVAFLLFFAARNLLNSRIGLAMRAMRDSPEAASALGVDIHILKTIAFVGSGVLGAIAGSLFAHYITYVSVQSFTVERTIAFLLIPTLAGSRSIFGIVVGAAFVVLMPFALHQFGDLHQIIFGVLLVIVVTLMPSGLMGAGASLIGKLRKSGARTETSAKKVAA